MNKDIFFIKNYELVKIGDKFASPASFKLDLREATKRNASDIYFSREVKNIDSEIKNFGCFVFGQPNTWKGIFGMRFTEKNGVADIIIYIEEYRTPKKYIDKIESFLEKGLIYLKNRNIIENFEKIN